MKYCFKCKKTKGKQQFNKCASRESGLQDMCRACSKTEHTKYCKENPGKRRERMLKAVYGLTSEQVNHMLLNQGSACNICNRPISEGGPKGLRLHIDHDHKTGKIRGLLCPPCNKALGLLRDSVTVAQAIVEYLKKHS